MRFIQEKYARDLHCKLQRAIGTTVSVSGSGPNWDCNAEWKNRSCRIHCFDQKGPEYLVIFNQGHWHATGRTTSEPEVISATKEWLSGQELSKLHAHFMFIDRQKRFLEKLAEEITAVEPELSKTERSVHNEISDLSSLWLRARDRSCKVRFWGKNVYPDALFHWDGCELFSFPVDAPARFALISKRWLCDYVAPSSLRNEFPTLDLKKTLPIMSRGSASKVSSLRVGITSRSFIKNSIFPGCPLFLRSCPRCENADSTTNCERASRCTRSFSRVPAATG